MEAKAVVELVIPLPYIKDVKGIGVTAFPKWINGPPKLAEIAFWFFAKGFTKRVGAQF